MSQFEQELKGEFLIEATQCLMDVEQCFLSLESAIDDPTIIDKIFRLAHNLKGSANAVGFDEVGKFAHLFESYLSQLKVHRKQITNSTISLLLECNDHLVKMIETLKTDPTSKIGSADLMIKIENAINQKNFQESINQNYLEKPDVYPLDGNLTCTTESREVKKIKQTQVFSDDSIRVSLARLEKLINFVGEMVILQTVLKEQVQNSGLDTARKITHQLGKVTKEVQDIAMGLRMVPLKQTFQKMQRIVRDTSQALSKNVTLELQGEETEVDKTILESISDPLVHLIRNAVDHGIEMPERRIEIGKPKYGTVILKAFHQSGQLVIEVKDDGAGINAQKLIEKAIEKKIIAVGTKMTNREAHNLIFHSGFSTKNEATDISGRGVGMDVVKTNIESLQGEIQVDTTIGSGSIFTIKLPLTLAIIDGMIIKCCNERYIIPVAHIQESLRPLETDVHYVSGLGEVLSLRGENIPLYRLNSLFNSQAKQSSISQSTAIVIRTNKKLFSILVDDIIGQQQVVIKQLGPEHKDLKGISGSAILGDGRPSLILEASELIKRIKFRPIYKNNELGKAA